MRDAGLGMGIHVKGLDLEGVEGQVCFQVDPVPLPGWLDFGSTHWGISLEVS